MTPFGLVDVCSPPFHICSNMEVICCNCYKLPLMLLQQIKRFDSSSLLCLFLS